MTGNRTDVIPTKYRRYTDVAFHPDPEGFA